MDSYDIFYKLAKFAGVPLDEIPSRAELHTETCNCDLRTKLVGDGCQHCNPELNEKFIKDNDECL